MYYIYVLRCSDNSLYTGITTDVKRRVNEHYYRKPQCAKYTKSHQVTAVEAVFEAEDKSSALKCEIGFKKLSKEDKEKLIKTGGDFGIFSRISGFTLEGCVGSTNTDRIKVDNKIMLTNSDEIKGF